MFPGLLLLLIAKPADQFLKHSQVIIIINKQIKENNANFLTTLKALAGAGKELVSSKYLSQEKCFTCE